MLLREHVLIHLSAPADKLGALLAMTAKLFSLAAGLCAEDNADALSSHEALLPGALLSKFMADKLGECLAVFKRQARKPFYPWNIDFPFACISHKGCLGRCCKNSWPTSSGIASRSSNARHVVSSCTSFLGRR